MKYLYNILTDPLGLLLEPFWEYVILLIIGWIVHEIAWNTSPGGSFGSLIYWVTKFAAYIVIWVVLYTAITVAKFVIARWVWFAVVGGALTLTAGIWLAWKKRRLRKIERERKNDF